MRFVYVLVVFCFVLFWFFEQGLTPDEQARLQELKKVKSVRGKEILQVVQSINDLAIIFRELSVLVIEQVWYPKLVFHLRVG